MHTEKGETTLLAGMKFKGNLVYLLLSNYMSYYNHLLIRDL